MLPTIGVILPSVMEMQATRQISDSLAAKPGVLQQQAGLIAEGFTPS